MSSQHRGHKVDSGGSDDDDGGPDDDDADDDDDEDRDSLVDSAADNRSAEGTTDSIAEVRTDPAAVNSVLANTSTTVETMATPTKGVGGTRDMV